MRALARRDLRGLLEPLLLFPGPQGRREISDLPEVKATLDLRDPHRQCLALLELKALPAHKALPEVKATLDLRDPHQLCQDPLGVRGLPECKALQVLKAMSGLRELLPRFRVPPAQPARLVPGVEVEALI
jgi:hypothetical protein